jgi:hypothetical protein
MVAVTGTAFLTVLTAPTDVAFGRAGLGGLVGLCLAIIAAAIRLSRSSGR